MRARRSTAWACWALERRVSRGRPSRNSSSRTASFKSNERQTGGRARDAARKWRRPDAEIPHIGKDQNAGVSDISLLREIRPTLGAGRITSCHRDRGFRILRLSKDRTLRVRNPEKADEHGPRGAGKAPARSSDTPRCGDLPGEHVGLSYPTRGNAVGGVRSGQPGERNRDGSRKRPAATVGRTSGTTAERRNRD
jgi:hypothetical protein